MSEVARPPQERRFTVAEYHAMARAGILGEDDRVELLDGRIIAMSPIGSQHAECVRRLSTLFTLDVHPQATVSVQNPIRLDNASEPEPDVALLAPKAGYGARHPRPDEVLLVVEVAAATLEFDRTTKLDLYARAGIREVWVVAIEEACVYVHRAPAGGCYERQTVAQAGDRLMIEALPDHGPFDAEAVLAL